MAKRKDTEKHIKAAWLHYAGTAGMENTQAYLSRGRPYLNLDGDVLSGMYVSAIRGMLADSSDMSARATLADVGAEFGLRGQDPPFHLIRQEMDALNRMFMASLTRERMEELRSVVLGPYIEDLKRQS